MEEKTGPFTGITPGTLVIAILFNIALIDILEHHRWCRRFLKWIWRELMAIRIDWEWIKKLIKLCIALAVFSWLISKFA